MSTLVVGIGDCRVSDDPDDELVTYALGSCIGLAVWDPVARVGGLLHFMLPESAVDRDGQGRSQPYKYADTGTPLLFRAVYERGGEKRRLVVRLAGGASVVQDKGLFNIGKRNYAAVRKILWKAGVQVQGEDVGGAVSRTMRLEVGSGQLTVRRAGGEEREIRAAAGPSGGRIGGSLCPSA